MALAASRTQFQVRPRLRVLGVRGRLVERRSFWIARNNHFMSATMDKNKVLLRELMSSCFEAGLQYQKASGLTEDSILKRLFGIFAQQRLRFAEELRECAPPSLLVGRKDSEPQLSGSCDSAECKNRLLDYCLESDLQTLALYREAIADTGLSARTRFLVSSQLALLELGHHRVRGITEALERNRTATSISA